MKETEKKQISDLIEKEPSPLERFSAGAHQLHLAIEHRKKTSSDHPLCVECSYNCKQLFCEGVDFTCLFFKK